MNKEELTREAIEEEIERIKTFFISKKYFRTYDLVINLLSKIKNDNNNVINKDFFRCYIYASNCARRLGLNNNELGIEYAKKALEYAYAEGDIIMGYDALATCYRSAGEIGLAIYYYDKCIEIYNTWLNSLNDFLVVDRNKVNLNRINVIHNKADMLKDVDLILESIQMYKKLLNLEGLDSKLIQIKIDNAYKNIDEILREKYN